MKEISLLVVEGNLASENKNFKEAGIQTHTESLKESIANYHNKINYSVLNPSSEENFNEIINPSTKKNDLKEETKEKSNGSVEIEKNINQTTSLKKENLPTGLKHIKDNEENEKENKESWIL